jgi:hypothetical protein
MTLLLALGAWAFVVVFVMALCAVAASGRFARGRVLRR